MKADAALAFFRTLLGIGEEPRGSNSNAITRWFGYSGAWCAMTISYVFAHFGALALIGGKDDYTVTMAQWFHNMKQWIEPGGAVAPGDIMFFHFGNPNYVDASGTHRWKGIHHVGMVEAVLADGRLVCLEGNHNDRVARVVRSRANVAGLGRPKYTAAAPAYSGRCLAVVAHVREEKLDAVKAALAGLAVDSRYSGGIGVISDPTVRGDRLLEAARVATDILSRK
jgi:hypothetical protein